MKILVRGTNWIGDAVMTIPAVRKLRGIFPDARLTLQTKPWAEGIFRDSGLFDEILTNDGFFGQVSDVRRSGVDLAVLFPNSFRSALIARLGGAERIVGFDTDARSWFLTDPVRVPEWKDDRHEVFYYLELVNAIEEKWNGEVTETTDLEPRLDVSAERRSEARRMMSELGIGNDKKIVALAAGSTNSNAKRWLPESFARLAEQIDRDLGASLILIGSEGEKNIADQVKKLANVTIHDLTGKTNLAQAAAMLAEIDLLVSNDMGLAHLAPAVGTETIVIFGPTNPTTTRPFSDRATIISAGVECSPCMLRECPIDHRCMTRVTPEMVFGRAKELLAK